jgi:hypothetical protein
VSDHRAPPSLHKGAPKTAARKSATGAGGVAWWAIGVAALVVMAGGAYGWRSHVAKQGATAQGRHHH